MPMEFGNELNQDFLKSILSPIEEQGQIRRGRARSESLARGLEGDPFEASAVGQADYATDRERNKAISDFQYNLAGMNREERLSGVQHGWHKEDQSWQASESAKAREFQQMLAAQGWAHEDEIENRRGKNALEGAAIGALGESVGMAGGVGLSKFLK